MKNNFALDLRAMRVMRRLSLRDVEKATGISNAYLSQLESGKIKKPSPFFLHKLAEVYGVDYTTFMESAGYLPRRAKAKTMLQESLNQLDQLNPEEAEQVAQFISFLRCRGRGINAHKR